MTPLLNIIGLSILALLPLRRNTDHVHPIIGEKSKWVVLKGSNISIAGHTTINRFNCGVAQYTQPDTLTFLQAGTKGEVAGIPMNGTLRLNIDQFDCRSHLMTDEFKKALQYHHYPQLKISFINLEKMPAFTTHPETVKGYVEIELAGACKLFEIDYTASRSDRCSVELTGVRQLGFHDFGLEPPRKMGGLVKVNDKLNVQFTLCLRQIE